MTFCIEYIQVLRSVGYPPEIVSGSRKSKLTPPDEIRYVCVCVCVSSSSSLFILKSKHFHSAFDLIFVVQLVRAPYLQSEVVTPGHANTLGIVGVMIKWILFLVRSLLPTRKKKNNNNNNKTEWYFLRCRHLLMSEPMRLYIYDVRVY